MPDVFVRRPWWAASVTIRDRAGRAKQAQEEQGYLRLSLSRGLEGEAAITFTAVPRLEDRRMRSLALKPKAVTRLTGVVLRIGPHVLMANADKPRPVLVAKVGPDGQQVRQAIRKVLGETLVWAKPHLTPLGIADEAARLYTDYGAEHVAEHIPETWLDELSSSGTPEQAAATIKRLGEAGADSVVLQPPKGDPACLAEYISYLMPLL